MSLEQETAELKMDPSQLYREEVITDQKVGTIRRLTPVLVEGGDDASRSEVLAVLSRHAVGREAPVGLPSHVDPCRIDVEGGAEFVDQVCQEADVSVDGWPGTGDPPTSRGSGVDGKPRSRCKYLKIQLQSPGRLMRCRS